MYHELKTDPDVFDATARGEKTFEIRLNDRGYAVDDELILRRTMHSGEDMANGQPLLYTGEAMQVRVTYILAGPRFGLAAAWVVMSVVPTGKAVGTIKPPSDAPKESKCAGEQVAEVACGIIDELMKITSDLYTVRGAEETSATAFALSQMKNKLRCP